MSIAWCRSESRVIRSSLYGPGLPFVADLGLQDLLAEEVLIASEGAREKPLTVADSREKPQPQIIKGDQ